MSSLYLVHCTKYHISLRTLCLLLCLGGVISFNACESGSSAEDQLLSTGKALAEQHCSSCHLPVSPRFADKDSWTNHILPAMAPKLGIPVVQGNQYYQVLGKQDASRISYADWMKIVAYYQTLAPEKLDTPQAPVPFVKDWSRFRLKKPPSSPTVRATTTLVAIDTANSHLYTSNATDHKLYQWDRQLNAVPVGTLPSPAVNASFTTDSLGVERMQLTCVGSMLAVDAAKGEVLQLDVKEQAVHPSQPIASVLIRPVQSVPGDFNKDGLTDWVVCSFGHLSGGLYCMQQMPNRQFEKKAIREVPGATQAVVHDYNGDGWPDILVLFAHGDEGIWLFVNDQKGGFASKNLLRFLPIYGSTSFQLVDFNQDGKLDILYTCGDNSDYSRVLKPYHGMYIFLNEGNFRYTQTYFYPINGCTKAMSADFDGDGDQDIATIAFFADLQRRPAETFLYFEQDKPFHFVPHAIPVDEYGRWICMDVNDYDGDGDPDIALGNYAQGFINQQGFRPQWDMYMPLILLENQSPSLKRR